MKISASRQRNAVSEGMALGLCMLDRYEFAFNKLKVDLAFEGAWRDWPDQYRSQYPQVGTDLRNGTDAVWVMTHADEKKQTNTFFWDTSGQIIKIYARSHDGWDSDNPDDIARALRFIDGDVPIEGWVALAESFLDDFGPHT